MLKLTTGTDRSTAPQAPGANVVDAASAARQRSEGMMIGRAAAAERPARSFRQRNDADRRVAREPRQAVAGCAGPTRRAPRQ